MVDCKSSRRSLEELVEAATAGDESCCAECDYSAKPASVRIATWASVAPTLQAYIDFYSKSNPDAVPIRLSVLPSMKELQMDTLWDAKKQFQLYDGYAIPPMLMGDLFEQLSLAEFEVPKDGPEWDDLLPYYRDYVATLDGSVRAMPLFAGNQMLLFYRKDYLESKGLSVPKTWGEFLRVAASLHNEPLGDGGTSIYGSCMGRLSEAGCRAKQDETGQDCNSLSMTYLGMSLSSMTQTDGATSGWLFNTDENGELQPKIRPALDRTLVFMEEINKYGAPNEFEYDSNLNMNLFRAGRCAMTFSADHPAVLWGDDNIGFAPLPGSFKVLNEKTDTLVSCDSELCPYAEDLSDFGLVNTVPFGAHDLIVGAVSAQSSPENQESMKEFLKFVMNTRLNTSTREQPLTYTGLQALGNPDYEKIMKEVTSSENAAVPLRIPSAYQLLSDADVRVNDYLIAGNYSNENREIVTQSIEDSWDRIIQRHDQQVNALPMSTFHAKSVGSFTPEAGSDLYIGETLRTIFWALGLLSCLLSIAAGIWTFVNKNERVVKSSQTLFLYLVCFGTLIMGSVIFTLGLDEQVVSTQSLTIACNATYWLYSIGFTMTYSALFSKMWHINRIFRNARNLQRIKLENRDLLLPFACFFGSNFIILLIWTIEDTIQWVRVTIEDPMTEMNLVEESTFGECNSEHYRFYLGIILGINMSISIIMLIQAHECRKISTDYAESLWISAAMVVIVQIWTIGLPIIRLIGDGPRALFVVQAIIVLVSCLGTLGFIFAPKITYLRQERMGYLNHTQKNGRDSVTEYDHSSGSEEMQPPEQGRMGNEKSTRFAKEPEKLIEPEPVESGMEGIRIIQSSHFYGDEVEMLQNNYDAAEARNKQLEERLGRLREKMEQFIVSHHPGGYGAGAGSFIIQARIAGRNDSES